MRRKLRFLICITLLALGGLSAKEQQFASLGGFPLENGSNIKNLRLGYRTCGKLNDDKSNAVFFPAWFGGTSKEVLGLIGPKGLIDSSKYFIVIVDPIGNSVSSSPTNSEDQKNAQFPKLSISDMVRSEYRLLTEILKIDHLFCAIGGSMGSMQVFEMISKYPDFVSRAIPYVCTPRLSSRDLLLFNLEKSIIESGHSCGMPEAEIMRQLEMVTVLNSRTPGYIASNVKYEGFPALLESLSQSPGENAISFNRLCQIEAMLSHDIYRTQGESIEETARKIKAKVFMILSLDDNTINPLPALDLAKRLNAPVLKLNNGSGHLAVGKELARCRREIANFLEN